MRAYLDHNATTPIAPEVRAAMAPYQGEHFGNPSSIHWAGRAARDAVAAARGDVARFLGAKPSEIVFTSGGSEALNAAIVGAVLASVHERPHLVVSAVEHPAVLEPCRRLARLGRASVTEVSVDALGRLDPDAVAAAVRPETVLVAVMRAQNEIGNLYDTAAVAERVRARQPGVLVLVDAVQAAGKVPLSLDSLGADLVAISAHKLSGPKGVGVLAVRRGTRLEPWLLGGPQEGGRRAGTENVAGIVGLAAACRLDAYADEVRRLAHRLRTGLDARVPGLTWHGDPASRLPGTLSCRVEGVEAESLLIKLDLAGVAASSGSACASGTLAPSHVLLALGLSPIAAYESIRLSLGRTTSDADVDLALDALPAAVEELKVRP